jgi:hypothetical protein
MTALVSFMQLPVSYIKVEYKRKSLRRIINDVTEIKEYGRD